jgi:peptide/nickel transport system ATP-binding protein
MTEPILEIDNLSISFFTRAGEIPAVMDFSCKVMPGEAMGLVGESGCGKSTVALGIMRDLGNNGRIVGGTIKFRGEVRLVYEAVLWESRARERYETRRGVHTHTVRWRQILEHGSIFAAEE